LVDLHVLLDLNVLEGSYVDESLAVAYDLCSNEILIFFLFYLGPILGKLVHEDLVEDAALSGIWNQ
jgi:hypothetical protein